MAQNNQIQRLSNTELAEGTVYNPRQVELVKSQVMPGADDDDLMLFLQVSSSRGLDPFRKHIYAVSRKTKVENQWVDKWSYQVSIDGLRLIAQRSGRYEGQTPAQWCGPDGVWADVWLKQEPPAAAKVGVYIKGQREPLTAIALWGSFVQTTKEGNPTKFWNEMGPHMLAKCAEAQALRKAFPEEAGGLYTTEEMSRSNPDRPQVDEDGVIEGSVRVVNHAPRREPETPLEKAKVELWNLAKSFGWNRDQLAAVGHKLMGAPLGEADEEQLQFVIDELVSKDPDEVANLLKEATESKAA